MNKHNILVGADPEIFVKKNGAFISAHGLIQGDKKKPQPVPKGAVQVDGMALEFNIAPAADEQEFVGNVEHVMGILASMVPEYELHAVPVADFSLDYIAAQPAAARELGCDPDFNAYTCDKNNPPNNTLPMRTASGHVHIGWGGGFSAEDDEHRMRAEAVARQMDYFLGLPALFVDKDERRRLMYGKAGCLRYKPYGMEYRTLSNFWLNSKELMAWVYQQTVNGVSQLFDGKDYTNEFGCIQEVIDNNDRASAKAIIQRTGIALPAGVTM